MRVRPSRVDRWLAQAFGAFLFALIAWPGLASAQDARPLQLEVFVNGATTGFVGSFTQSADGRLAATRKELLGLGIQPPGSGDAEAAVVLDGMPGLQYQYDEPRQRLDVVAGDERRVPTRIDARGTVAAAETARTDTGFVLNYLAYGSSVAKMERPFLSFSGGSAQLDARLFSPYGTIAQTGIVGKNVNSASQTIRLDTTYTFSHQETATTTRVGDILSSGPAWSRPIRLGGLSFERNYGLRPDVVTAALPVLSGSAAAPTTMDVYVNNVRTFSRDLPIGPYSVANIPGLSGSGNAQVVLRDAQGREVRTNLPFYTGPSLLQEGLFDYSAQAGFARYNYAFLSNTYGRQPLFNASARYGLTKDFTLEGHGEAGAGLWLGGVGMVTNVFNKGLFSLAGQASHYGGKLGLQIYAGFETRIGSLSLSASSTRNFGNYLDLATVTARQAIALNTVRQDTLSWLDQSEPTTTGSTTIRDPRPPRSIDRISIGMPGIFDRSTIGLSYIHTEQRGQPRSHIVNASYTQVLGKSTALTVNAYADLGPRRDFGVFAGLSMPLGGSGQASVGATHTRAGASATVDASRPLGTEVGSVGYRIRDMEGARQSYRNGAISTLTPYGRAEVSGEHTKGSGRVAAEFEGSIAAIGGGIHAGPRIDDAFAVVDTGTPGVDVFHENRRVGRTDMFGRLVVPGLVSYQRNTISIDPTKLPVNAHVERTQEQVVPASRGGVVMRFGVEAAPASAIVVLHGADGKPIRAGVKGKLGDAEFVIGHEGRAFIRGLTSTNRVTVELPESECAATFDFKPSESDQVVIGPVTCQ